MSTPDGTLAPGKRTCPVRSESINTGLPLPYPGSSPRLLLAERGDRTLFTWIGNYFTQWLLQREVIWNMLSICIKV